MNDPSDSYGETLINWGCSGKTSPRKQHKAEFSGMNKLGRLGRREAMEAMVARCAQGPRIRKRVDKSGTAIRPADLDQCSGESAQDETQEFGSDKLYFS